MVLILLEKTKQQPKYVSFQMIDQYALFFFLPRVRTVANNHPKPEGGFITDIVQSNNATLH